MSKLKFKKNLSHFRLRELFYYSPKTGLFTRIKEQNRKTKVGEIAGSLTLGGYIAIKIDKELYFAHRLAWFYTFEEWPEFPLDHINGAKSDNRLANLRQTDSVENSQNSMRIPSKNKFGFNGIRRVKGGFEAALTVANCRISLGKFDTPEEAGAAYLIGRAKYHVAIDPNHRAIQADEGLFVDFLIEK